MSRTNFFDFSREANELDPPPYPSQRGRSQEPQPEFADSSGPLFFMYQKMAEDEDNKMAERWQKDAEGILLFSGLFSAAVAALVTVTVLDLRQDSQDKSAFYLESIYKLQVAGPSVSRPSIPAQPPPFSPPMSAIWVNALWFLSLAISLTCAMLATLLQQWARRYLRITQPPRYRPHERARIRAFFAHGVDKFHLSRAADVLPTLIQLSLFLFFAGLLIYLFNLNNIVFRAVVWWVGVSAVVYMLITLMPIFRHETPYYAPLSSFAWSLYTGISYLTSLLFCCICCCYNATFERFDDLSSHYRARVFQRMEKIAEETIQKQASKIDGRVLKWTFDTLIEDHDLDRFFQCILGFRNSKVIEDPHRILHGLGEWELSSALVAFLHRTWSSNFVTESDKIRRLVICVKVADAAHLLDAVWRILDGAFNGDQRGVLECVETGLSLTSRSNRSRQETNLCAENIVGCVIASARKRDHRWVALVADHLGASEDDLRDYLGHGDSVLLANLVYVTRQFHKIHDIILRGRILLPNQYRPRVISQFTRSLSKFDIRNTLPRLQHDFCALWNELVQDARRSGRDSLAILTLIGFRRLYIALHHGTDAAPTAFFSSTADDEEILRKAASYPLCNHSDHQADAGASGHTRHPPSTTHPTRSTNSHHDAALTISLPLPNPTHTSPHHADQSLSGNVLGASGRTILIATSSRTVTVEGHPPQDIADSLPHGPVSSPFSASTSASSHITPQVASISNPITTTIAIPGARDHAQDPNNPTRPESSRYRSRPELAVPDILTATLQSESRDLSENTA